MNKKRKSDFLFVALFCGFVFVFSALFIILPKKKVSELEKKTLAAPPKATPSAVLNGKFSEEAEAYLSDHFPARRFFIGVNAKFDLYSGRNGVNGVYKGKDGYLINAPVKPNGKNTAANTARINAFAKLIKPVPVDLTVVPSTGYIYGDKLPLNHRTFRDAEILRTVEDGLSDDVRYIDLLKPFESLGKSYRLFYKTDHHYTSRGAYETYKIYCGAIGVEPLPESEYTIERRDGFYGTVYSRAALWSEKPDVIEVWRPPFDGDVTVEIYDGAKATEHTGMFFTEQLNGADKYSVFLNGNHGLVKISNPGAGERSLLIVKDSFAHCAAPFLSGNFGKIIMVDPRYYKQPVSSLIRSEGIDRVLFLYGIDGIVNDTNLVFLR